MPTHPLWSDDYWPLIMQLYMSKPTGIKPLYSRPVVDLGIRLHIPPKFIFAQMHLLREHATPFLQRLWDTYAGNTSRLNRDVRRLRQMSGFGAESAFYDGVSIDDDFADDFRPIADDTKLTRVMLIIILDLYFRLTPITMVCETPEVGECASLLGIKPQKVVEVPLHLSDLRPNPPSRRRTRQPTKQSLPHRLATLPQRRTRPARKQRGEADGVF